MSSYPEAFQESSVVQCALGAVRLVVCSADGSGDEMLPRFMTNASDKAMENTVLIRVGNNKHLCMINVEAGNDRNSFLEIGITKAENNATVSGKL